MELYKKTKNLEFDAVYADGTKKRIHKGILFEETEKGTLDVHIGTDNQLNLLIAIVDAVGLMLQSMTRGKVTIRVIEKESE